MPSSDDLDHPFAKLWANATVRIFANEEQPLLWRIGTTWIWWQEGDWKRDGGIPVYEDYVRDLLVAHDGKFEILEE